MNEIDGIAMFLADGPQLPSTTTMAPAGRYVVVFATLLHDEQMRLTSCYYGSANARQTGVAHLLQTPPGSTDKPVYHSQRLLEQVPGQAHASSCLLDHIAEMQGFLGSHHGRAILIGVQPSAIADVDDTWEQRELGA
jgi:hypothetical protein